MTRCGICKRPVTPPTATTGTAVEWGDGWAHRACRWALEAPGRVYDQGYTEGARGERRAVVAWLRAFGSVGHLALADAIERCDHGDET